MPLTVSTLNTRRKFKVKKVIIAVALICAALGLFFAKDSLFGPKYHDGTYTGVYTRREGSTTTVDLTIKDGKISACTMVERDPNGEIKGPDYGKGSSVASFKMAQRALFQMKKYPDLLVQAGDMDGFDALSGATVTYKAMKEAVDEALRKAR